MNRTKTEKKETKDATKVAPVNSNITLAGLYQAKGEAHTQLEIWQQRLQAINKRLSEELSKKSVPQGVAPKGVDGKNSKKEE